jgi:hypothetical protein
MAKQILEINKDEINTDEQERVSKKKKIVFQFDDVQHFVCKDLPFALISNKSIQFFQRFRISGLFTNGSKFMENNHRV